MTDALRSASALIYLKGRVSVAYFYVVLITVPVAMNIITTPVRIATGITTA